MTTILSERHGLAGWILPQLEPTDLVVLGVSDHEDGDHEGEEEEEEDDIDYLHLVVQLVQRVYQVSVEEKQQPQQQQQRSQKRRKLLLATSSGQQHLSSTSHTGGSSSSKEWRLPVAYLWALTMHQTLQLDCANNNNNVNKTLSWEDLQSKFLKLCKPCYKPMTHLDTHAALALLGWQLLSLPPPPPNNSKGQQQQHEQQQHSQSIIMQGLTASTVTNLLSRTEYVKINQ